MNNPLYNRVLDRVVTAQSDEENVTCLQQIIAIKEYLKEFTPNTEISNKLNKLIEDIENWYLTSYSILVRNFRALEGNQAIVTPTYEVYESTKYITPKDLRMGSLTCIINHVEGPAYINFHATGTNWDGPCNWGFDVDRKQFYVLLEELSATKDYRYGYAMTVFTGDEIKRVICTSPDGNAYTTTLTYPTWRS